MSILERERGRARPGAETRPTLATPHAARRRAERRSPPRTPGVVLAAGAAAVTGLGVASAMPRGPVTAHEALVVMAVAAAVGLAAGFVLRSRWAIVFAPAVHVAAFELGRAGADGPSVDAVHLDTVIPGIATFVVGRGFHGLLAIGPMAVAAALGAALARQTSSASRTRRRRRARVALVGRRAVTAVAAAGLGALALTLATPATTPPILGADGDRLPGSVAELTKVTLGGHEQWLLVRGRSVENPVLLSLAGGPGGSDLGMSRVLLRDLEGDFVVVNWDQRGAGKSYGALDPPETLTLDGAVADTVELTNYLRRRFDERKIYLLGESWGSTLGVLAAQRRPDLFHAYVGSGQMVSQRETDRLIMRELAAYAEREGDQAIGDRIRELGEPPFDSAWDYLWALPHLEKLTPGLVEPEAFEERVSEAGLGPLGVMASEYDLVEKMNVLRGLVDTFDVMYPQLQAIDFRRDVPRLDVPVYVIRGGHELRGRDVLVPQWLAGLRAPIKRMVVFDRGAHAPAFEEFGRFHRLMTDVVLPETYGEETP